MQHAGDNHIVFSKLFNVAEQFADESGIFRYPYFRHVVLNVQRIAEGQRRFAGRNQPPADQGDKECPGHGYRQPDQGEVEHLEGIAHLLLAEVGNYDVGRRAYEGGHPAQQGGEGQGHEEAGGGMLAPVGHPNHHRQQQADRADVVHKGRQKRRHAGKGGDTDRKQFGDARVPAGDYVHHAGVVQGAAQDQHRRHGNHRRMPKAHVGLFRRDDAGDGQGQQGANGNYVVAPLADDEEH